jgi:hypothetical protein
VHAPETPDQPEAGISQEDSLFLYCPYDRRVTRHGRRWADRSIVCAECGNSVEVSANRRDFTPIARPENTVADRGSPRDTTSALPILRRERAGPTWPLFAALGAVATFGVVAALLLWAAAPFGRYGDADALIAPSRPPAEVAGVSTPTQLFVGGTGGTGVYLRESPDTDERIRAWPDGTVLRVIGPDETVNGAVWRNVEDPAGNRGWVPAQYTSS